MKRKMILCGLTLGLLLSACSHAKLEKNKTVSETNSMSVVIDSVEAMRPFHYLDRADLTDMEIITTEPSYAFDISDFNRLQEANTHVLIARIDRIEGASTTIGSGEFSPLPKTYGSMTVLHVLKGEVSGNILTFAKAGGVISRADYEKDAWQEMLDNDAAHRTSSSTEVDQKTEWMDFQLPEDIRLEAGKTYLLVGSFYDSGVFGIDGVQYGSREIVGQNRETVTKEESVDLSTLFVTDNVDGSLHPLSELIRQYFP